MEGGPLSILLSGQNREPRIDPDLLRRLLDIRNNERHISTAGDIIIQDALSGGVILKSNHSNSESNSERLSVLFYNLCRQIIRRKHAWGFCPVQYIPDEELGVIPQILNIESRYIRTTVHYEREKTPRLRYWYNNTPAGTEKSEITSVRTLVEDMPSEDGNITSVVFKLLYDIDVETNMMDYYEISTIHRSLPRIIYERLPEKFDTDNIRPPPTKTGFRGNGYRDGVDVATRITIENNPTIDRNLASIRGMRQKAHHQMASATTLAEREKLTQDHGDAMNSVVQCIAGSHVPQGCTLSKLEPANCPEHILELREERRRNVYIAMGIPSSLISESTSIGKKIGSNQSGGASKPSTSSSNDRIIFRQSQKNLKRWLIHGLKEVWRDMFFRSAAGEVIENNKDDLDKESKESNDDQKKVEKVAVEIEKTTEIEIDLPGIPDEEVLDKLLLNGMLKSDFYKEKYESLYYIPHSAWEPTPKLTVKEMNGIVPKPPSSGGGGASGPAKKKAKKK